MMNFFNGRNARKGATFVPESFADGLPSNFGGRARVETDLPKPPALIAQHVVYSRSNATYGQIAENLGLLTKSALSELNTQLQATGETVGEIAVRTDMLTREQNERVLTASAVTVHVDNRHAGSPQFLTWIGDLIASGNAPHVNKVTAQVLEELRISSDSAKPKDALDLVTVNKAKRMYSDFAGIGASEVTLRVSDKSGEIQVRVDGDVKDAPSLSMKAAEGQTFARAIFEGLSTTKDGSYTHSKFQNAQISGDVFPGTGLLGIRIKRGPCYPEEAEATFLTARLQYKKQSRKIITASRPIELVVPEIPVGHLDVKGLDAAQIELFERLVRIPHGIAIVTGPMGSGKTTTIYEGMKYQAQKFPHLRQVTMERPVENPMPWATQLVVGDDEEFQKYLAETLRMDGNIGLLGEATKAEEAIALFQAAMTGTFYWATLHVTDPYGVPGRLEMLDPQRLNKKTVCDHENLIGIIAQRLLPGLCQAPGCKQPLLSKPDAVPSYMTAILKTWNQDLSNVYVRGGSGCPHCSGTGITGREGVAEIVLTTPQLMFDLVEHGVQIARRNHRQRPGSDKSMLTHAMDRVFGGLCDPNDVNAKIRIEDRGSHED